MNLRKRNERRFKDNPLEKTFAELWDGINKNRGHSTLDFILAEDPNCPKGEVTDRDRDVAGVVIQWLGSNVGQYFLSQALGFDIRDFLDERRKR